jgi:hypothetical protein
MTDTEAVRSYPYRDGDVTVLGPEIFASKGGAVISWRGENYVRQQDIEPGREELAAGAMHELASSVRDLASAIRLETADRTNPTPAPADSPLRQRIAEAIHRNRFPDSSWDRQPGQVRADYLDCAVAVLAVVQPELGFWADAAARAAAERDTACAALNRVANLADRIEDECAPTDAEDGLTAYDGGRLEAARHIRNALQPPADAHNAGPSVAECAAQDAAHWNDKYAGEGQ